MTDVVFAGLPLSTDPGRVMTPRAASEQLVTAAIELVGERPARVVDVGTGSGAIALAIAAGAPAADVWATDTSRRAVALARLNAHRHGLSERMHVRHGDLLDPVPGRIDVVVANLPYLPAADAAAHPDLDGEPAAAVYAAGDGLDAYRRLLDACEERLAPDGAVVLQLHRRALAAPRATLAALAHRLELHAALPQRA